MQFNRPTLATAAGVGLAALVVGAGVVSAHAGTTSGSPAKQTTTVTVYQPASATATVYFANRSSKIRTAEAATLTKLARSIPKGAKKTRGHVVASVQRGGSMALSVQRATKVRNFVKSKGVGGTWTTKGIGVIGSTKKARRATVTINYLKPVQVTVTLPARETVTATATATATTTATVTAAAATETVTATATATETVTATATVTATTTVTATPEVGHAPVNLRAPAFVSEYVGDGMHALYFDDSGEWEGGTHEPDTLVRAIQTGTYGYDESEGWSCGNWVDRPEWGASHTVSGSEFPECARGKVTATNGAGSTVAYSNVVQLPV